LAAWDEEIRKRIADLDSGRAKPFHRRKFASVIWRSCLLPTKSSAAGTECESPARQCRERERKHASPAGTAPVFTCHEIQCAVPSRDSIIVRLATRHFRAGLSYSMPTALLLHTLRLRRDGTYPKASFTSNAIPALRNIVSNSFS
jgi:hypothetical protein